MWYKYFKLLVVGTLQVSLGSGLHPTLDVGNLANSLRQILDLGDLLKAALVREIEAEVEDVKVGPAEGVDHQELSSARLQPLLDVGQTGRDGLGGDLLHGASSLAKNALAPACAMSLTA